MHFLKGCRSRFFIWSILVSVVALTEGCQTSTQSLFTSSGPGWTVRQGQALWRPRQGLPEVAGDLVMVSDGSGRCSLQFDKTPLSLVMAQTTPTRWLIRFPVRHMGFGGHEPPPTRFAWLQLPAALAGAPLPSAMRFQTKPDGGWHLENTHTGESLDGFLSP